MSKNIDFLSLHSTQNQTATNGTNNQFQQNISYINNSEPEEKNNDEMSYTDDKFDMKKQLFFIEKTKNNYSINQQESFCQEQISRCIQQNFTENKFYDFEADYDENFNKIEITCEKKSDNQKINNKDKVSKLVVIQLEIEKKNNKNVKNAKNNVKKKYTNKKRKNTNVFFKTINFYCQVGNKNNKKCFRKQDVQDKIMRNFIQEIIPIWVTGTKPIKSFKINRKELINNIKKEEYKNIKILELCKEQKNLIIPKNEITNIKLEFTLKEAFLCYSKKEERKNILVSVLNRLKLINQNIDHNSFFNFLDKQSYINSWATTKNQAIKIEKAFTNLINDLETYNLEK